MPRTTIRSEDVTDAQIKTADMAVDPTNATNLATGTVPTARLGSGTASATTFLRGDQSYAAVDTSGITANKDDIALLGFKVAANGSLARYNLVDQSIDAFEDASGVDASASTNETRNASNYYSGAVAGAAIQAFKTSGAATYTATAGIISVEVLVVGAGGGGGSYYHGAGGGAGGIVHDTDFVVSGGQAYGITVGAKGARGANSAGSNGADSSFDNSAVTLKLIGKGGGGGAKESATGSTGGSGGGGTYNTVGGASTQADFAGATSYGSAGGGDTTNRPGNSTGGGGGASAVGGDGTDDAGGPGGAGQLFSTFVAYGTTSANVASTGSDGGYFGGGGGGSTNSVSDDFPNGGVGGGAAGSGGNGESAPPYGVRGTGGTGGGGGAGERAGSEGGDGDNGGVYVKENDTNLDMTLVSNAVTAEDGAPTTGDLVITYTNGAGTAVANTDIKAYISRDGSAYTSAVTLADQGDTGGHTMLTANGVDLSGITSGTSMRWKIETLNQSASKSTRIQAVSLGWA